MRLLIIVGARCASLAFCGNFLRSSSNVMEVNILAPVGWRIVLVGIWSTALFAGASFASKDTLAPESSRAVVFKSIGLEQPELKKVLFTKLFLIK